MAHTTSRTLLAVYAHPDDESFGVGGTLIHYSRAGARVALVCATRGERGEISDPALATPDTLGTVREAELRGACAVLGVSDLTFMDYMDGDLNIAPFDEAVGKVVSVLRRLRPQVVVTFNADGGYGHTDHIAIHHITMAAFAAAGDPTSYPEQLMGEITAYRPDRLYASCQPKSVLAMMRRAMAARGVAEFQIGGNAATLTPDQMGLADEAITTRLDIGEYFDDKIRAVRCHRTQLPSDSPFNLLANDEMRAMRGSEWFVRLLPPGAPGNQQETDLFAGL